jgi:hypothetical protein
MNARLVAVLRLERGAIHFKRPPALSPSTMNRWAMYAAGRSSALPILSRAARTSGVSLTLKGFVGGAGLVAAFDFFMIVSH